MHQLFDVYDDLYGLDVLYVPGDGWTCDGIPELMATGAVKRRGRGRPRVRPDEVAGDKGYSSLRVRRYLRERGIRAVIPTRTDQAPPPAFDRAAHRERNPVERLINRLEQWRRLVTCFEKRAASYGAMVTIAAILLWP